MAGTSTDVLRSIHVVSISASSRVAGAVSVVFGDRPPALEDNTQGDHASAYALYESWIAKIIDECISECQGGASNPGWVINLIARLGSKVNQDNAFLTEFGLNPDASGLEFSAFATKASQLREDYTEDQEIKSLTAHKGRVESDATVPQEFIHIYENRLNDFKKEEMTRLDRLIAERKIVIASKVAQEASIAFLEYKNKRPYVAFKQVRDRPVDRGQGGRIWGALKWLNDYKHEMTSEIPTPIISASSATVTKKLG